MRFRAILMAMTLVAAAGNQVAAQQQTGTLVIRVRNKMSGAPLSGAQVSVVGTRLGTRLIPDGARITIDGGQGVVRIES